MSFCRKVCWCTREEYGVAEHKMYRILFKHFHKKQISASFNGATKLFDFAAYLTAFWEHLVISMQEIPITSWLAFLFLFWVVVATRQGSLAGDTSYINTAIALNLFTTSCFQLLIIEQKYSIWRINSLIARTLTGNPNATIEDAVFHMHSISKDKATWDHDGSDWQPPSSEVNASDKNEIEQAHNARAQKRGHQDHHRHHDRGGGGETKHGVELTSGSLGQDSAITDEIGSVASLASDWSDEDDDGDIEEGGADLKHLRTATWWRMHKIKQKDLRHETCLHITGKRVVFSGLVFIHAFLYGWFIFINMREMGNSTLYYAKVKVAGNASSSASSGSSARRMLLASTTPSSSAHSSSAHSSSAHSSSAHSSSASSGPSVDTATWATCDAFHNAGSPPATDVAFNFTGPAYTIVDGYSGDDLRCTVHDPGIAIPFVLIMTFPFLLTSTFYLIPLFLRLYAYQKALVGTGAMGDMSYLEERMKYNMKDGTKWTKDQDGGCCPCLCPHHDKNHKHHDHKAIGEASHHASSIGLGMHHARSGGHGHGHGKSWKTFFKEMLVGKDDVTFSVLIKSTADDVAEELNAVNRVKRYIKIGLSGLSQSRRRSVMGTLDHDTASQHELKVPSLTEELASALAKSRSRGFQRKQTMSDIQQVRAQRKQKQLPGTSSLADAKLLFRAREFYDFMDQTEGLFDTRSELNTVSDVDLVSGLNLLKMTSAGKKVLQKIPLPTNSEIHMLMRYLDKNADGNLTQEEFVRFLDITDGDERDHMYRMGHGGKAETTKDNLLREVERLEAKLKLHRHEMRLREQEMIRLGGQDYIEGRRKLLADQLAQLRQQHPASPRVSGLTGAVHLETIPETQLESAPATDGGENSTGLKTQSFGASAMIADAAEREAANAGASAVDAAAVEVSGVETSTKHIH